MKWIRTRSWHTFTLSDGTILSNEWTLFADDTAADLAVLKAGNVGVPVQVSTTDPALGVTEPAPEFFLRASDVERRRYRNSAQALRDKLATNTAAVWQHLGDSTANGPDEWLRLALPLFAADYPNMRVTHELWNDATKAYDAPTVVQAGISDDVPAPTFLDTFTRVSDNLYQDAADTGQVWGGSSVLGAVDGSSYVMGVNGATIDTGIDYTVAGIRVTMKFRVSESGLYRLTVLNDGADHLLWSGNHTNGASTFGPVLYKRVNNVATQIGAQPANIPIPASPFEAEVTITITKEGACTATTTVGANTHTITADLPTVAPDMLAAVAPASRPLIQLTGATGVLVREVSAGLPAPDPTTLRVINGSMPGASTDYLVTNLNAMTPAAPDLLTVSSSHNHGSQSVPTFVGKIEDLVDRVLDRYPNAGVAVSSQNPQFTPVVKANRDGHRARLAALPALAARHGWGYIAGAEPFLRRADRGKSWVIADGVHPDAANGSPSWRDAALAYLRGTRPHYG